MQRILAAALMGAAACLCLSGCAHVRFVAQPVERGTAPIASCYGNEGHQWRTATGERYRPWAMHTAAHRSLPFGTRVLVTNLANGREDLVRINDRGPAKWTHREIDLSLAACRAIGSDGLARVRLEVTGSR
jgi:rare lipoprotein A